MFCICLMILFDCCFGLFVIYCVCLLFTLFYVAYGCALVIYVDFGNLLLC